MENQRGRPLRAGGFREGKGPAPQSLNGDDVGGGRGQRRGTRSESQGSEEEGAGRGRSDAHSPAGRGLRAEGMWFNRSMYEPAESSHRTWWNGTLPPPSSPRDRVPRTLVFRARPNPQQHRNNPDAENRPQSPSRGAHLRRPGFTHYRSSSEPHRERYAPRAGRKRGYSETDRTPQRDNMSGLQCLAEEKIWFDKSRYDEAERRFYEGMNGVAHSPPQESEANAILQDIAKARQNIQKSLAGLKTALHQGKGQTRVQKNRENRERKTSQTAAGSAGDQGELISRMRSLELDNQNLHKVVDDLRAMLSKLDSRMVTLEKSPAPAAVPQARAAPVQYDDDDDDDDIDLFGSDEEEDEEAERIKAQRVKEYSEKKAKKPTLIAKSSILLDVKPWDDETDMAKLEECVRSVQADGLLWGTSKLVPVGYGIKKLQIACVVEDDKVGTDMLEEEITSFEDYVQSVDVAAFNKI